MLTTVLQFLFNGIVLGCVYALVSMGFAVVYNTTRVFHIAYAVLFVFSPYMVFLFHRSFGFPLLLGFAVAIFLTAILSFLFEVVVYRPLYKKSASPNVVMMSSIGLMIIIINIIAIGFGNNSQALSAAIPHTFRFGNISASYTQIVQLSLSLILILSFLVFLRKSRLGVRLRAYRDDEMLFSLFGSSPLKVRSAVFIISGVFAAVGGGLVAYDTGMTPYVGMPMFLNAAVALIVGGIGEFEAPLVGGLTLGILQAVVSLVLSSTWQDTVTFALLILFLLFRPQGFLGEMRRLV